MTSEVMLMVWLFGIPIATVVLSKLLGRDQSSDNVCAAASFFWPVIVAMVFGALVIKVLALLAKIARS